MVRRFCMRRASKPGKKLEDFNGLKTRHTAAGVGNCTRKIKPLETYGTEISLRWKSQAFPSRPSESSSIGRQAKPGNLLRIVRIIRHTQVHCIGKGQSS
jgi:hypothetical protein